MSSVYSTQIAASRTDGTSSLALYTVPAGYVAVLRDVALTATSTTDLGPVTLYIVTGTQSVTVFGLASLGGRETHQWTGRQVLNAGDVLRATAGGALTDWLVSGYLLSAP